MSGDRADPEIMTQWLGQLQTLQFACTAKTSAAIDPLALTQQALVIKQIYQTQIVGLDCFETHPQGQGILTEVHRRLRLLETQGLFLKTARSSAKQQQQQQLMGEHAYAILTLMQALQRPDS